MSRPLGMAAWTAWTALLAMAAWTALTALSRVAPAPAPDPLAGYRVAPGWKVTIAAAEPLVVNPVTMTFGLDGRLYVVEWREGRGPNDRIKVLTDLDDDGTFDKAEVFMDGLDLPAGVLFWDGWTYVTLDHDVVRFRDDDGDGTFEVREVIAGGFGNESHHRVSGMVIGPDGWLYLTTGDSDARARGSDGSTATVLRSGGVFRCRPDGSHLENVAFGMRNPWGNVAFDDEFHIVHTDNDNEGTPAFTGCRLLHVVEGGDYGWRLREGAPCCSPDFERATWNGGRPGRLGWMAETGRGAPAGLCVLNSAAFPPSTRNLVIYPDLFQRRVRAYKLTPAGATFTAAEQPELLASADGLFRPNDAEIGPDGALYILDWRTDSGGAGALSGNGKTGRIYRMSWGGTEQEPARPTLARDRFVKLVKGNDTALVEALKSDDYGMRRTASMELIRRGTQDLDGLIALATARQSPATARRHALAVLSSVAPSRAVAAWEAAIRDPDHSLSRLALELATRFGTANGPWLDILPLFPKGEWNDEGDMRTFAGIDPPLLRALALYAGAERGRKGRQAEPRPPSRGPIGRFFDAAVDAVAQGLADSFLLILATNNLDADPVLRDAFTRAYEAMGPDSPKLLAGYVMSPDATYRDAALFILQGWRNPDGLATLLAKATGKDDLPPAARAGLFRALRELVPDVPPDAIADWLRREPRAAPAARVEAIRVLKALHGRALSAGGPVLPLLLADNSADVRRAALELAEGLRSTAVEAALLTLAQAPDRSAEERGRAVAALRAYEDQAILPTIADLYRTTTDAGLKVAVLRTLAALDFPAAAARARALLTERDAQLRGGAILLLGEKPATALELVHLYNAGKVPPEDLVRVAEAVRAHATPELRAELQAMLKDRLLGAQPGLEAQRFREFVAAKGNSRRGLALYFDDRKTGCAVCHRLEGRGGSVGPDLTRISETLSFEKRVESILEPSKEIKEGFGTFKVATADGRTLTGLLLADTPEGVTLKDAQGQEVRIPQSEVDQKGPDPTSLMPVGVVGQLSLTEFADLLHFLGDRNFQEKMRAQAAGSQR